MRPTLFMILAATALGVAVHADAQGFDAAAAGQQNQLYMEQEALRQRSLELERQAFAAQQKAETEQALASLQAQRNAAPSAIVSPPPDAASAYEADADTLRRIQAEAAAPERSTKRSKPVP